MPDEKHGRQLPHSEEAEMGLLGSAMEDPTRVLHLCLQAGITSSDFYMEAHRTVYDAMLELQRRGRPIDVVCVSNELKRQGELDRIGGPLFLDGLIDATPTAAHAEYYAEVVRKKAARRSIIRTCWEGQASAYDEESETDDVLSKVQTKLFRISRMQEGPTRNVDAVRENMTRWGDAAKGNPHGLECYLQSAKHLTGRYRYGKPYFTGASPGAGKSTILLNQFTFWAVDCGIPVAINSIEMDHEECIAKVICERAGISLFALDHGFKDKEGEKPRLQKAWEAAVKLVDPKDGHDLVPLWFNDRTMDVDTLWAWARFMVQRHGILALGIDYLQILNPPKTFRGTRREGVIYVLQAIRQMAKELKIVVMVLSQLKGEARYERRPRPSDMKESSDIEDVAEQIVMLYEWPKYEKDEETGKMEKVIDSSSGEPVMEFLFDVQKNKRGVLGEVPVWFNKSEHRIQDIPEVLP
jgi:replicative DNA helicase